MRSIWSAAWASRRWEGRPNRARKYFDPREPRRLPEVVGLAGTGAVGGVSAGAEAGEEVVLKAETLFVVAVPTREACCAEPGGDWPCVGCSSPDYHIFH